jgi:hypothetical protein
MGHSALMYKIIGADLKEYGPVSAEQLRQWIAEGRVNAQTKVQAADATEWKAMADCPEFADVLPKAPPPPPTPAVPIAPLPAHPRTSPMAVWAMVMGIASLTLCCCVWFLAAPVAIVLGAVGLSQFKSHPELTGRGFAITGIVLGIVTIVIYAAVTVFCFLNPDFVQSIQNQMPR